MKNKSIAVNYVLNLIKTTLAILFPLISYPYVSRILSVSGLGSVNFSSSYVNYFILFATFGINVYAVREGAKHREDKDQLSKFATEMLVVNIITSTISLTAMLISLLLPALYSYRLLIVIFGLSIIFNTFGMEWYFQLMEEYRYITIRAIVFQIISLISLFVFVKTKSDVAMYAVVTVFANVGSQILNFFRLRQELYLFKTKDLNVISYFKPMFLIFLTLLAMNFYRFFDVTMLGFIKGDVSVGYYTLATKITSTITTMVSSVTVILTPRLAFYFKNNREEEFKKVAESAFEFILMLSIPIALGIFLFSSTFVDVLGGPDFIRSSLAVQILSPIVLVSSLNGLLVTPILTVVNRERKVLRTFVFALLFNVLSNFIAISFLDFYGAAFTTICTELFICIASLINTKDILPFGILFKRIPSYISASFPIVILWYLTRFFIFNNLLQLMFVVSFGALGYFMILYAVKNPLISQGIELAKNRGRK